MRIAIYVVLMLLKIGPSTGQNLHDFNIVKLGGLDLNGDQYQKRYFSEDDTDIEYENWDGIEVKSNDELISLLNVNPNCEAIRFNYWNYDTINNFELTQKIGCFKKLKYLELNSNRIRKYPLSIEKLTSLEELVLQVSGKDKIEFSFSEFTNLKHLTIHFADDLKVFPSTIFDCIKLETLKLFRFFRVEQKLLTGIDRLEKLRE